MDNSYLGAVPAYGRFQRQSIIGDGSTTVFNLDYPVSSSTQILVSIDGVVQEPSYDYSAYTTAGQGTINFSQAVTLNARVSIIFLGEQLLVPTTVLSSPHIDTFTSDGSTTTFTLTRTPSVDENGIPPMVVFANGAYLQYGSSEDYTVSGNTILLNSTYPVSNLITVIQLAESNNVAGSVGTIPDNSITAAKLSLSYTTTTHSGDGSTTQFTIESGHDANSILVFYNGICMVPNTDYSVSTTNINFTFAPISGSDIMIRYLPV